MGEMSGDNGVNTTETTGEGVEVAPSPPSIPKSPFRNIDENLRLLGTAHVSKDSVAAVKYHIEHFKPDIVAVELCESRYTALMENRRLDQEGLRKVIKEGKAPLVLIQSLLSAEQRKMGLDEGEQPGAELVAAVKTAQEHNLKVELVDRDIQVTLRRAWKRMRLREKVGLIWGLLGEEEDDAEDIELSELLENSDLLSQLLDELRQFAPGAGEVLVDERDAFLSGKIAALRGNGKVLAVVGAGHLNGIEDYLSKEAPDEEKLRELSTVPKPNPMWKVVTWGLPIAIMALAGYFIYTGDKEALLHTFTVWTAFNAGAAALFCLLARGHPLAIITAALASPITSLNPTLAAGWFAGYVQMRMAEPTAQDLQDFMKLDEMNLFWKNKAGKVLLVTALTNVGSMLGAWIAAAGLIAI
ncbi:MAG: TraB family protein [Methanobacteriota archaeon]|nr:MAG: TraB family protein [Euryarchaeota archaeon]